jgi:GTP-binding protein
LAKNALYAINNKSRFRPNARMPTHNAKVGGFVILGSQGEGKGSQLEAPLRMSLERAIEYIGPDELVEATPNSLRLRKRIYAAMH